MLMLPYLAASLPTKEIVPGVQMPMVSAGTWTSGSLFKDQAYDIATSWLNLGFRGIDTALNYFDQKPIAQAISDFGVAREDLFITSKIPICESDFAPHFLDYDLAKLNTTYIDLMLLHLPIGLPDGCPRTWEIMEKYVEQGKFRALGVSNFNKAQMQRILDIAKVPIAVNQIEYNVFHHDDETIQFCREHNITVEAWSPLGGAGLVPGPSIFKDETMKGIAVAHNVSAAQVALRWIVQRGDVLAVMSAKQEHQANDADLWSFELEEDEMAVLNDLRKTIGDTPAEALV